MVRSFTIPRNNNTALCGFALENNSTGGDNTAIGQAALRNSIADNNTAAGAVALQSNTTGTQNTAAGVAASTAIQREASTRLADWVRFMKIQPAIAIRSRHQRAL